MHAYSWQDSNLLTGPIPQMSNLTSLHVFLVEHNRLTGRVGVQ